MFPSLLVLTSFGLMFAAPPHFDRSSVVIHGSRNVHSQTTSTSVKSINISSDTAQIASCDRDMAEVTLSPALEKRAVTLPNNSWQVCFDFSMLAGKYQGHAWPVQWSHSPILYEWKLARCVSPYNSPEFTVTCKMTSYRGYRIHNGDEVDRPGSCGHGFVCVNGWQLRNGYGQMGVWNSIQCVPWLQAQLRRLTALRDKVLEWCSPPELLDASKRGGRDQQESWQLSMELDHDAKPIVLWFEIKTNWWKSSHKWAPRSGTITSAVINSFPSMGDTFVKFCARLSPDPLHAFIPVVAVHYSWSILPATNRHHLEDLPEGIVLNVEHEPADDQGD